LELIEEFVEYDKITGNPHESPSMFEMVWYTKLLKEMEKRGFNVNITTKTTYAVEDLEGVIIYES
jgi:hypothetical protein